MCRPREALPELLQSLASHFPERSVGLGDDAVGYRRCGAGAEAGAPTVVLLHGIGSGAASWLPCALALAPHADVIAWNAPGYGNSATLPQAAPTAADYARRLHQLLAALGVERCVLVGHSLGALVAAAYADAFPGTLHRLLLLSPAQGYGSEAQRERGREVAQGRLDDLANLGVRGMAGQRSPRMLSPRAGNAELDWVRWNMQQLNPAGYRQAVQLLCGDALEHYSLAALGAGNAAVRCGADDIITPPQAARALAQRLGLPYQDIADAGHACYIERPDAVADAIREQF